VIEFLEHHIAVNPRHSFGLIYNSARYQGKPLGHDRDVARVL